MSEAQVTIIGAGTSGLAVAACLRQLSIPYTLLEREYCFASIWQKYSYDRVHLHLPKAVCELPLRSFPPNYPTYVSKNQFLLYLNDYVSHFDITPVYGRSVVAAAYDHVAAKWKVKAQNLKSGETEEYESRFVVVATGETCDPWVPEMEGLESFGGEVMHSTRYKNGKSYAGKRVLVVGSGNSGMEIALDLANHRAKTAIVVRSPINIVSRQMVQWAFFLMKYLSPKWVDSILTIMSKVVYGNLRQLGIERPKEGPFTAKVKYGKYPIIDVGTMDKIKCGQIEVLPGIRCIKGNNVLFENEKECPFHAIVFATGFKRSTKHWLHVDDLMINDDGLSVHNYPNNWKGKNGLYCVGLARRGFYGAAADAQNIAHHIKATFDY